MIRRATIVRGLKDLGLKSGDRVLVHSSMAAIGEVEGGADAVIDALLETVGPRGLVVVPTFACAAPFDRLSSRTPLGAISDKLWRRPEAVRSLHPTHSVAAIGEGAAKLIKDHEKAPTAYGEGTPYHRLTQMGGKILLLGVDQDRNTTLHTAEALAGAVYLKDITGTCIDGGKEITIPIAAMAGPHRDFIGLDRLLGERGVTRVGKIGSAECRLMDSGAMLKVALEALAADPAAVLCDNPACVDCVRQRGKIKAARLARESFRLVAVADDISEHIDEIIYALEGEGISSVEVSPKEFREYADDLARAGVSVAAVHSSPNDAEGASLSAKLGVPWIVRVARREELGIAMSLQAETGGHLVIANHGASSRIYEDLYASVENAPPLAFDPAEFARAGEKPFLGVFYNGVLRKHISHFYIDDYSTLDRKQVFPGLGNGEVKEIVSMLRCRSYDGLMILRSHNEGVGHFREAAAAFWKMLDNM